MHCLREALIVALNNSAGSNIIINTHVLFFQVQLTDFENAAYVVFIVLLTRVILSFQLDLIVPISKVCIKSRLK